MRRVRGPLIVGAIVTLTAALANPLAARAASSGSRRVRVEQSSAPTHVDGHYKIVSTDCYFSAGSCTARFDIEQHGSTLNAIGDRYFHGNVNGVHVHFGETWPPGVSEDSWWCQGTTSNGGRTVTGTMTDGIGGSGTFRLTYQRA
jgi:hypothetical protein